MGAIPLRKFAQFSVPIGRCALHSLQSFQMGILQNRQLLLFIYMATDGRFPGILIHNGSKEYVIYLQME